MVTSGNTGVCCLCRMNAGLWGWRAFWEVVLDTLCAYLHLLMQNPWAQSPCRKSVCQGHGKDQVSPCQGSTSPPRAPRTSVRIWWGFSSGVCSARVAGVWEPVGWNRQQTNLTHENKDLGASYTEKHRTESRERSSTRKHKPYFNQFPLKSTALNGKFSLKTFGTIWPFNIKHVNI